MQRLILVSSLPVIGLALLIVYAWWPWTSEDLVAHIPSYLGTSLAGVVLLGGCCAPLVACCIYTGILTYAWRENIFPKLAYFNYGSSVLGYAAAMGTAETHNKLACFCLALSAVTAVAVVVETTVQKRAREGALLCAGLLAGVVLQYLFLVSMTLSKGV
jgi:hypothetical protein